MEDRPTSPPPHPPPPKMNRCIICHLCISDGLLTFKLFPSSDLCLVKICRTFLQVYPQFNGGVFIFFLCSPPPPPPHPHPNLSFGGAVLQPRGMPLHFGKGPNSFENGMVKSNSPPHPPTPLCKRMGLGWNLLWWWFSWFSGVVFVGKKDPQKEKKLRQYLHLDESFII